MTAVAHRISPGLVLLVTVGCASGGTTRDRSRGQSVEGQLAQIASFRTSNHRDAALAELDRLLKRVAEDGGVQSLSAAARASLDVEIRGADETVRASVDRHLTAGHPLAAENELARLAPMLTDVAFAPTRQAGAEAIRKTGQQACVRLQETVTPETPYWGLGVSRYCGHFGVIVAEPPRSRAFGSFEVSGAISGLTGAQSAAFRGRVADWLRASLWFDPTGQTVGRGTVDGKYQGSVKRQTVTLHTTYKQKITVATSGWTRGTVSRPTTSYGTTTIDQTFPYDTEEIRGDYMLGASVKLDVGMPAPVSLNIRRAQGIKGYDHDVTFEPAGISPRHDQVPSEAQWFNDQVEAMSGKAIWALNRKFITAFCKRESFAPDDAVRCLVAGQQPPAALAAVAQAIGESAEPLIPILRPPPPPEPEVPVKAQAKKTTRAKPSPNASSGATDDEDPTID